MSGCPCALYVEKTAAGISGRVTVNFSTAGMLEGGSGLAFVAPCNASVTFQKFWHIPVSSSWFYISDIAHTTDPCSAVSEIPTGVQSGASSAIAVLSAGQISTLHLRRIQTGAGFNAPL